MPVAGLLCVRLDTGQYVECEEIAAVVLKKPKLPPLRVAPGSQVRNVLCGVEGSVCAYSKGTEGGFLVYVWVKEIPQWWDACEWELMAM